MPGQDINNLRRALEKAAWEIDSLGNELDIQDPVEFSEKILGIKLYEYQRQVLTDRNRFQCLRWSRQSGKTFIVSVKILWTALTKPGSRIAIVAPSVRQSKNVLRKVADMASVLPRGRVREVQKMKIEFTNGSIIDALPNNPNTIRGPSLDLVYIDEMNFIRDDVELFDAILFTISTTGGRLIISSTPASQDSLFYKICNDPTFSQYHVTWKDALSPHGPLLPEILDAIRKQFEGNPWRWRREMEAEFADDETSFLPLKLLTGAIDRELEYWSAADPASSKPVYMGVDFGKHRDHSVVAVVEYDPDAQTMSTVHMHQFPLETDYDVVIGYAKAVAERWDVVRVTTDATGVGDSVTSDMEKAGIKTVWPVRLELDSKIDVMDYLRGLLVKRQLRLVYDPELLAEMNCEKFELSKQGKMMFSHPAGTHDDRLWALALACHGLRYGIMNTSYYDYPRAVVGPSRNIMDVFRAGQARLARW